MTADEILTLSETSHTPGLHRCETLAQRAKGVTLNDAYLLLSKHPALCQINPFRFKGPGYQEVPDWE